MRKVIGFHVVMLVCVVLSSCASSPEKAYMGTWEGTYEGETVELSFMEKGIWIVQTPDNTTSGTWTVDPEGDAQMTYDDGKAIATTMSDGRIVVKDEDGSNAAVLKKTKNKE